MTVPENLKSFERNLSQCIFAFIILSLIVKMCLISPKKVVTFAISLTLFLCSFSFYSYKTHLKHTGDEAVLFLKLCETFSYVGYFEYNFRGPPSTPKRASAEKIASNCILVSSNVNEHSKFHFDVCFDTIIQSYN